MTARGLGLLRASVGDHAKASAWLEEAHIRCSRVSDRYQWIRAYVLVATALDQHDHGQAGRLADTLAALAARGGMRELVVRAHLHRNRLGDPTAWPRPGCWPPPSTTRPWPGSWTAGRATGDGRGRPPAARRPGRLPALVPAGLEPHRASPGPRRRAGHGRLDLPATRRVDHLGAPGFLPAGGRAGAVVDRRDVVHREQGEEPP
jgi:hypothetical protein